MARLVLPSATHWPVATSEILRRRDAGGFWRFIGGCGVSRSGLGPAPVDLTHQEIMVGHANYYRGGALCWEENDFAYRGAVSFLLSLRDAAPGFHEREQAWLTWYRMDDARTAPFHDCALAQLGRAEFDWAGGVYPEGSPPHHLAIAAGTALPLSDVDAVIPRTVTPHLRRVEVTGIVRDWVERTHPNFGFVFVSNETFVRPPNLLGGPQTSLGILWRNCIGIYAGFELVFAPIGYVPSYGLAEAAL
jgi:hypothetical protein